MSRLTTDPALAVAVGLAGGCLVGLVLSYGAPLVRRWVYQPRRKR